MQSTSSASAITIATCCPSGYYCRQSVETSQIFACISSFASDATLTLSSYSFNTGSVPSGTTTVTATAGETVRAYGPIVRRAADDPTWANAIPTTTVAGSAASASSSSTTGSGGGGGGGLSTGAKAGIGVGVSVGFLLVVAACAGGFVFGKRAAARRGSAGRQPAAPAAGKVEGELMGEPVQELSAGQARHELYPSQISELDGSGRK
ncbi:hypothetical protein UCRNP2_336 [Neofusicoccum parvum UCRNP2]|uniref:Uncharacterized protein n=1 Tax=Botryosphaeria parva (strain UCR-NP2) TaxID=1287680 RepID=R1GMG0_BOTPV|nr:hypothetical protein UCRNP2_336 [Neofusicoccum parvum UCRNP2]